MLREITIPNSVKSIGMYAFFGCSSLEKIVFPSSLTRIGQGCFLSCSKMEEVIFNEPSSLELIGFQCFFACKSLKQIEIPSSVKEIDSMAFMDCDSLSQITLPSGIDPSDIGINSNVIIKFNDTLEITRASLIAENESLKKEVLLLKSKILELESRNQETTAPKVKKYTMYTESFSLEADRNFQQLPKAFENKGEEST